MARTIQVRIPVAVDHRGRWFAFGWPSAGRDDAPLEVDGVPHLGSGGEVLYWVTAELAVPEPAEIAGKVETVSS